MKIKNYSVRGLGPAMLLGAVLLFSCGPGAGTAKAEGTGTLKLPTLGGPLVVLTESQADLVCYIEPTEELKNSLTPEEYEVLVQAGTEPPFQNAFWNNHREGIYVDRIDGTPLFASSTKFDSGTGWPSFWSPIDQDAVVLVEDRSYGMYRIEVRSKSSGGHLGHVFKDGPKPTGLRYCINSASLAFVPKEEMEAKGYGKLLVELGL
ncbi:MAG: peptide-methionine (R)-S-oxide reductase MsrB [Spirochaetota bacterium]